MKRTLLPLALLSAFPFLTHANEAAEPEEPSTVMGEVRISAARNAGALLSNRILTSVDVLGSEQIEDKTVGNSWELVGQLPGVQLTEFRMGAESGKATFRAFNGEGYINGIKVLIDGIPSNVNSGNQRFIDMVFPLEIDYIEVVRGTNDPRYGLHNIGGNINLGTRQGGNYTDSRLTAGSFATRELQFALGRESDGFAQNYFLAKQDSGGYRAHSDSDKYSFGAKWFLTSDDKRVKAGLVLRTYRHDAEEPGFLTAREMAEDRDQSPRKNANDVTEREMKHASVHLDWQITPDAFLSNKVYFNDYQDDRRVTFTGNPAGTAPRQRRLWDEEQVGLLSTLTLRLDEHATIETGVNTERQDNRYGRLRYTYAIPSDFTTPAQIQNDDRYALNNVGAYAQAILKVGETLKIVPGLRVDRFTGHMPLKNGTSLGLQESGWIRQPKFSMVYSPMSKLSVYGNWGRTFQVLTGSGAPAYLAPGQARFAPSINTGKEVGVKFKPAAQTELRLAAWRQDATDEVANMPATGTTVGLGETRREGIDLQVSSKPTEQLDLWFSHSLQKAEVRRAFTAEGVSLAGKEVFATPRTITNAGAEYRVSSKWRLGLQGRAQGSYFIDNLNAQGKFGGFVLFDANLRYAMSERASIDFQVKNLADRRHAYAWYDNFFWPAADAQAMFAPGPGRAAYLSLNLTL
jgi:iron complex outermembrane recepter protein